MSLTLGGTSKVTPYRDARGGGGSWNPSWVFVMLQHVEKISPFVKSP